MACYHPLDAFQRVDPSTLRNSIHFKPPGEPLQLKCGQCIGCRLDYSLHWAIRIMHEAKQHDENCFITLTYDDEHLPADQSLVKEHFQKFMKKLRKRCASREIRYFHCGEYGGETQRPHYHAALFGIDFHDCILYKETNGIKLYISPTLEKIWGKGICSVGHLTFDSAAYVARYICKKITGDQAAEHYERIDEYTGEIINLQPEYCTMSRNDGIGRGFYDEFSTDIFPNDICIYKGKPCKPPRYYDNLYELTNPEEYKCVKDKRKRGALKHAHDNTPERLATKEKVKKAQYQQLKRTLE